MELKNLRQAVNNSTRNPSSPKAAGKDGRDIELRATASNIEWRYKGLGKWYSIIAIKDLVGPPGPKGPKGDTGATGAAGPKGDQGIQGEKGAEGKQIELRVSETHIQWRYVGDEQWKNLISIDELIGPQGERGDKGEKGDKGDKGDTGDAGPQGDPGAQGEPGPQGDTGPAGDTGPTGPQGFPGPTGPTGPQGPNNLFIQDDAPVTELTTYAWIKTSDDPPTLWVEDGA